MGVLNKYFKQEAVEPNVFDVSARRKGRDRVNGVSYPLCVFDGQIV